MKRLDLDDLSPRIAQILIGLEPGEELLLVQNGGVVGRLTGGVVAPAVVEPEVEHTNERASEVFENFRASMEDEF